MRGMRIFVLDSAETKLNTRTRALQRASRELQRAEDRSGRWAGCHPWGRPTERPRGLPILSCKMNGRARLVLFGPFLSPHLLSLLSVHLFPSLAVSPY
ncbi:hypothetical protein BJX68DRAFT_246680 [Aspergillus pseudodeflectus]|uniref:Uncharacterized protein n=1 Tax=Aspergillus pseudodeflectus TaxID=176178 RepID=A0ABR4JKC8_9EURO